MIFGEAPTNAVSLALARHWGLLIFCVGVLLVYAASHPAIRGPAMVLAAIEKVVLGVGVLGTSLRKHLVASTIAAGDLFIAPVRWLFTFTNGSIFWKALCQLDVVCFGC